MEEREELLRLRNQEDITADGKQIKLLANIGNLDDLNTVLYYGATGIGLLRSEFQYLGRENYPRENELFRAYKKVAEDMEGRPVVIRTVDLGADRQAEYMAIPDEVNPMMGNRGIRLCLDRKKNVQSPASCHLPGKCLWKHQSDVSDDHIGGRTG